MKAILGVFCALLLACVTVRAEVTPLSGASKVQLNELPQAAQDAIKAQAGSAEIEDIDKGTLSGRTVYEAAFKKGGQNTELRVAEDGTVVDTIVAGVSTGTTTPTAPTDATPSVAASAPPFPDATATGPAYGAGFQHQLSGARKVSWEKVPADIQQLMKQKAGTAKIEDIDVGTIGKQTVHQAAYKKNGKHVELRVGPNGWFHEVANGVTLSSSAQGTPGGVLLPLQNQQRIAWSQLPQNVQTIVKERLGADGKAQYIDKGSVTGKTVYDITFSKSGQQGKLRVGENGAVREVLAGRLIYERAGAEAK